MCGPPPMLDAMTTMLAAHRRARGAGQLRSVSGGDCRQRRRGAGRSGRGDAGRAGRPPPADAAPKVQFKRSGVDGHADPGQKLLEVAEGCGAEIPSLCRCGVCGTCRTKVMSGNVHCPSTDARRPGPPGRLRAGLRQRDPERLRHRRLRPAPDMGTRGRRRRQPFGSTAMALAAQGGAARRSSLSALAIVATGGDCCSWASTAGTTTGPPLPSAAFMAANRLLRPSAPVGHLLGIGGFLMMLVPVAYAIRKKVKRFRDAGRMQTWLDVHIFCGIVGPVLVTFHTSFKFNGLVSVAYWSMVTVVLSGFVGRYLYAGFPRSIRGQELSEAELDARAAALSRADRRRRAARSGRWPRSTRSSTASSRRRRRRTSRCSSANGGCAASWPALRAASVQRTAGPRRPPSRVIAERATLRRRIAYLKKTKGCSTPGTSFHMPLVYVMFAIVVLHVAVTLYMGYVPFADEGRADTRRARRGRRRGDSCGCCWRAGRHGRGTAAGSSLCRPARCPRAPDGGGGVATVRSATKRAARSRSRSASPATSQSPIASPARPACIAMPAPAA